VRSLLWVALTDQPLGMVADTLRQVGAQNWAEGFPDTLYGNVARAMVQTVHYLCAHDWSASMGSAWITYFMWIKPHLLAARSRPLHSTPPSSRQLSWRRLRSGQPPRWRPPESRRFPATAVAVTRR